MFVTLEGGDACGKSTQIRLLAEHLKGAGREIVTTREPGGSVAAEAVRALVKSARFSFSHVAEQLLFMAARRDHIDKVIRPALDRGAIVLCDRFVHSTLAYQGGTDPAVWQRLLDDHARFCDDLLPDMAIYIDVDREEARRRLTERGSAADDAFERRDEEFQEQVRAAYRAMASVQLASLVNVDGVGAPDEVAARIAEVLANR